MTPSPSQPNSLDAAMRRMTDILQAENQALEHGDLQAAAHLLPDKDQAAARLRAVLPDGGADPVLAAQLRQASTENGERLSLALAVQGRILDLVARAARAAAPPAPRYGRSGTMAPGSAAQTLALRA